MSQQRWAIVGAGWAGLAAAVRAVEAGHDVTLFEAAQTLGGRARSVEVDLPNGERVPLDNGQHVLLGAYRETLGLMQRVGIDLSQVLAHVPVKLGLLQTQRWSWRDYASLALTLSKWGWRGMRASTATTVQDLSAGASERVRRDIIESLCLSALNTHVGEASGAVFLRVIKDAFLSKGFVHPNGRFASSDMLVPNVDLGRLFPDQAARWLQSRGADVRLGERVASLAPLQQAVDHIVVATPPWEAARLLREQAPEWAARVDALQYRAIATVYALANPEWDLKSPLRALPSDAQRPAQFVFARPQAKGLLAFVVSDAKSDRETTQRLVLAQGQAQLGVALQPVTTIVEKRATFACLAHMTRPAKLTLAALSVVGDYVEGPYPSTIEGAMRSAA